MYMYMYYLVNNRHVKMVEFKLHTVYVSGGPMIDYNRKLIEKFKRRDNRFCFFHNRLSPKN